MSNPSLAVQLLTVSVLSLQRQIAHTNLASRTTWGNNYDFIVVGAGGAGAIVAARLSENPSVNVLLLEAGGSENEITDIPSNYYELLGNPEYDWYFPLVNQPNLGQAYSMPAHLSVGKVLGGSTTLSGMVYNRGNSRNFDEWDHTYGCRGWNYSNILPYFLRSENQIDRNYLANGAYHNTSGPITVSSDWNNLETELPIFKDYLRTAQMSGYNVVDFNGPSQNGVTLFEHTIKDGSKVTASSAYLSPNRNRTNLQIVTRAHVTRIGFNGQTANSVTFTRGGRNYTVMASREIILSAGTIGSAQLLMLSGVGPQAHLASLGIPLVANLPVGNNLHDHTNTILYFDVPDQSRSYETVDLTVQNLYNYYVNHRGPLTMFPNAATYISTNQNTDTQWPDIMTEMVRSNSNWNNISNINSLYGVNQEAWTNYWAPYSGRRLLSFDVQHVRPRARGTLRLASTNPYASPLIDPNYFGNAQDMDAMVDGIRTVLTRITTVGPFSNNAKFLPAIPGCTPCYGGDRFCEAYLRCFIRATSVAVLRHVGTCRCGANTDQNAVVDERLRVMNVHNLRVIDGGIMPQVINANSWIATAMIGEYGAQMVLDDNRI